MIVSFFFGPADELAHREIGVAHGIVFFLAQLAFAHWWFRHFKRGPLETIWHRLTWLGKTNR